MFRQLPFRLRLPSGQVLPLVLALALAVPLPAMDGAGNGRFNDPGDEDETEAKAWHDMEEKAAKYHRERASATPEQRDDAVARRYLDRARELLLTGHEIRARWWAEDVIDDTPYSSLVGEALRMGMEGGAVNGDMGEVREKLQMLWLYVPNYPGMGEAMDRAMSVAEDIQDFSKAVNLETNDPAKVISLDGRSLFNDSQTKRLMRFLAVHGDRASIAPRAALGLARGLLLTGGKDDIRAARKSYELFLEDYPAHPLTFTALCEYALSYMVAYRGEDYDLGALNMASAIIDQAEIETKGDAARSEVVQAYRKRLRSWLQDRDLSVARWYLNRGTPWLFAWLKMPAGLQSWEDGSRYFYREVIKRDATSEQGRTAERELAEVPVNRPDTLGAPVQR